MKKRNKVLVGMSGGVDSSVAAYLLKKRGFDVSGGYMKLEKDSGCCTLESQTKARETARVIGIPFYSFSFEKEFQKRIISQFIKEYEEGITPNPCVDCNKEIKFGLFWEKALALGFDYVATGHYARIRQELSTVKLLKGKDENKDQSYFLWRLDQKQLKKILFPIGNYTKKKVRELAKKHGLPSFNAEESQEVCFVKTTVSNFLKNEIKEKKGEILSVDGKNLGTHQGIYSYTIGQRKGLNLPGGPYFVVAKDALKNILIISKSKKDLLKKEFFLRNVNWISGKKIKLPLKASVKIRYGHNPASGKIIKEKNCYKVVFNQSQTAITSGQSAVFYKGSNLLGGGKIV